MIQGRQRQHPRGTQPHQEALCFPQKVQAWSRCTARLEASDLGRRKRPDDDRFKNRGRSKQEQLQAALTTPNGSEEQRALFMDAANAIKSEYMSLCLSNEQQAHPRLLVA
jgi:hypothetical protein